MDNATVIYRNVSGETTRKQVARWILQTRESQIHLEEEQIGKTHIFHLRADSETLRLYMYKTCADNFYR